MAPTLRSLGIRSRQRGTETTEGGGVRLTRLVGSSSFTAQDPFLMLDEFRSDRPCDYLAGFPEHPHRGFETLTYMLAGVMEHRDHLGNHGLLKAGGLQWMRAGRGVLHSEMPQQRDGLLWGFQLWLNLPARAKMSEPDYRDFDAAQIPQVTDGNGVVRRVIAGDSLGVRGAASELATQPLYLDVTIPADVEFCHPVADGDAVLLYLYQGGLRFAGEAVEAGELLHLGGGDQLQVRAAAGGARLLLLAAQPIGEPVVQFGPFVMNSDEEIQQALKDYRSGRLV